MRSFFAVLLVLFTLPALGEEYKPLFHSKGLFKKHVILGKCEVVTHPDYCRTYLKYQVFRGEKLLRSNIIVGDEVYVGTFLDFMYRQSHLKVGREMFPLITWSHDWRWFGTFLAYPVTIPLDLLKLPVAAPVAVARVKYRKKTYQELREQFDKLYKGREFESLRIRRGYFKDIVDRFMRYYPPE